MSTSFYANAIIGIEIDIYKVSPNRKVRKCKCIKNVSEDMKFCPSCGYKAWENAENPIDGLEHYQDVDDGMEYATLFGIPIVCVQGYDPTDPDHYRTLQMFAVAAKVSHGDVCYDKTPEMVSLPDNLAEMKETLKKALEPNGLWDESKFGLWAIGEMQ
jgi:hypothetical protein